MGGCCDHAWDTPEAGLGFWGGWWPQGRSLQSPSSSTASWGSVVLLVPRRWQQTPALKPHMGTTSGCWGFHQEPLPTYGSIGVLAAVSPSPVPGLHCPRYRQRSSSHPQLSSCGHSPRGGFHRAEPSSTRPMGAPLPPEQRELPCVHFKSCIHVGRPQPFSLSSSFTIPF